MYSNEEMTAKEQMCSFHTAECLNCRTMAGLRLLETCPSCITGYWTPFTPQISAVHSPLQRPSHRNSHRHRAIMKQTICSALSTYTTIKGVDEIPEQYKVR